MTSTIISGSNDTDIKLWDINDIEFGTWTVECSSTLSKHTGPVISLELLPRNRLASGSVDTSVLIWDLKTGNCTNEFLGHWGAVECLASIKENQVISGSSDKTIRIWDTDLDECLTTLIGHTDWVTSLQVIDEGYLMSGAGLFSTIIWDLKSGNALIHLKCQHYLKGFHHKITILESGILVFGTDDFCIKMWNLKGETTEKTLDELLESQSVCENRIITYDNNLKRLKIYDLNKHFSGERTDMDMLFVGHTDTIMTLKLLTGGRLASGAADHTINIWDLATGECLKTLAGHLNCVTKLLLLNDDTLVSGSWDHTIRIWNLKSGECLKKLEGHTKHVTCLALIKNSME